MTIPAAARPHLIAAAQSLSAAVDAMASADHPETNTLRVAAAYVSRMAHRAQTEGAKQ